MPPRLTPAIAMQAVLFNEILKPLSATLGPIGDAVVDGVVRQTIVGRP